MTDSLEASRQLMLVETFELAKAFTEYEAIVKAFCKRVEQDGLSGVRLMQHYFHRELNEAYVILIFANADIFKQHLEFIFQLDEITQFSKALKLKEIKAFGKINDEQAKMLKEADFHFDWIQEHITGFVRG